MRESIKESISQNFSAYSMDLDRLCTYDLNSGYAHREALRIKLVYSALVFCGLKSAL
ncbi:hypothetical protein BMETH_669_1 [methanotrophic bacterial endosymbiont of Bathymodiolus sp.]|nr:hypothetical protein BMETH_669_1 [methanotrophic bacterial endosymbiont of Bathymodiolus sp.]